MNPTEVRLPRAAPVLIFVTVLVPAVGLGFGLPSLARWLQSVLESTPFPVHGAIDLVADLSWAWTVPILAGLGLVGGVWIALTAVGESLRLTVFDDHLEHRVASGDRQGEGWVERSDVSAVFRDGRFLVLLAADGRVRARLDADDLPQRALRDAFVGHGWPWAEQDPYEDSYVSWVDGRPGFTEAEHVLLRRRHRGRKDAATVQEVDAELGDLGLAVRVRDDRLQVRRFGADTVERARGADR